MGFAMTPASGYPPPTPDEFPNYIQFQSDGTNLGLPDADVVDFVYPLVATRGTGENENVVTVTTVDSPSAPPAGSLSIFGFKAIGSGSGTGILSWSSTVLHADDTVATYNALANQLTFAAAGVYQVTIASRLTVGQLSPVNVITLISPTGSNPDEWTVGSNHQIDNTGSQDTFDFVDVFLLDMQTGDLVRSLQVTTDNSEESLNAALTVSIIKLP